MLRNRDGWMVLGSSLALAAMGCGGTPATPDTGIPSGNDTGMPIVMPDAARDAFMMTGDPFANYETAITAARRQECECTWMDQGFKSVDACLEDQLTNDDIIDCAREGYMAARSGSADHYNCVAGPLATYASCRMAAGCGMAAEMAITACVEAVNGALMACPEVPMEAQDATTACFQRDFIGPASMCPEPGAAWMGLGTFTGDTALAGNDSNPDGTCFPDGMIPDGLEIAPERAYRWVAPGPGRFMFDTVGTDFDTVLYVRSGCTMPFVGCQDDVEAGMITTSQVTVTATAAGQEFIVVVDGFSAQSQGPFTVTVTMAAALDAGMMATPDGGMGGSDAGMGEDAP